MAKVIQYGMGFLENICVRGNLGDSEIASKFGVNVTEQHVNLTQDENQMLGLYLRGYYLIQKAGEFIDYQRLPYWKYLRVIPPIPSVVSASLVSERVGIELLDETSDHESILKASGGVMRNMRSLANLLSGVLSRIEDEKISNDTFLKVKQNMSNIVYNWSNRPENKL